MPKLFLLVFVLFTEVSAFSQSLSCGESHTDPNGPQEFYTAQLAYSDTFYAPSASRIQIEFSEMALSDNDTIFLLDPLFPDVIVAAITNETVETVFLSWSNSLILSFSANNPVASNGWQAEISCLEFDFMLTGIELDTLCESFEGFVPFELTIPLPGDVQIQALLSDENGSFDNPTAAGESFAADDELYIQIPAGLVGDANYRMRFIIEDELYSDFVYEKDIEMRVLPTQPLVSGNGIICSDTLQLGIESQFRIDYQWYFNGNELANETDTLINVFQGGVYTIAAINACGEVFSPEFIVTELDFPLVPEVFSSSGSLCPSDTLQLLLTNGLDESNLTWYNAQTTIIENVELLEITSAGSYYASRENACGIALSDTVFIEALQLPAVTDIQTLGNTQFCEGEVVTLSVEFVAGVNLQWFNNTVPVDGDFSIEVFEAGNYSVELSNQCGAAASQNEVIVEVLPLPTQAVISAAGPTTLCEGNSVLLLSNASAGNSVQWLLNGNPVSGTIAQISANQSGQYSVLTSTSCGSIESDNTIDVQINPLPEIPVIFNQGNPALCNGSEVNLFVSPQDNVAFVWKKNGSTIGSNSNSIVVNQAGVYSVTASNSCGTINSVETVSVTSGNAPQVPVIQATGPTTFCEGLTVNLQTSPQNGLVFTWLKNGIPIGADNFIHQASQAGVYTLEISNACDTVFSSNSITINLNPLPPIVQVNPFEEQNICLGESVQLSIPAISGVSYQWKKDGDVIGQNQNTLTTSAEGEYTLTLANTCGVRPAGNTVIVNVDSITPVSQTIIPQPGTALCEGGYVLLNAQPVPFQTYTWFLDGMPLNSQSNAVFQATSWGNYTVQAVNACGISEISEPVTLGPGDAPEDFEIYTTEGFDVCSNDSIALTAQVAFGVGIRWYLNSELIAEGPAQIYVNQGGTFTADAFNGCGDATGLNSVSITVLQAPEVPVISLNGADLTTTATGELQWYNSALQPIEGENTQQYTPAPSNATYFLSVSNENGCMEWSEPFNYIVNGLSYQEILKFEVFPNPASDKLFLKNSKIQGEFQVFIVDIAGRIVNQEHFSGSGTHSLNLSGLAQGIYYCKIIQDMVVLSIDKVVKS
ncbi:MAG: T9SS type A sorting domain-containing protein [Bacteroidia bacterium]